MFGASCANPVLAQKKWRFSRNFYWLTQQELKKKQSTGVGDGKDRADIPEGAASSAPKGEIVSDEFVLPEPVIQAHLA